MIVSGSRSKAKFWNVLNPSISTLVIILASCVANSGRHPHNTQGKLSLSKSEGPAWLSQTVTLLPAVVAE
jgi:hypothetical protein